MKCYNCGSCSWYLSKIVPYNEMRFECFGRSDKGVYHCRRCGFIQLLSQWTEDEVDELYKKYSQKKDFVDQMVKRNVNKELKKYFSKKDLILEVGCGRGDNIEYYRNLGYNVVGVEKDETVSSRYIRNIDIFDYDTVVKYDVIYALHVLEHMNDPKAFIEHLKSLLAPGGIMIFEVPNVNDPLLTIYGSKAYDRFYWYPYHHFFFSPTTFEDLLKVCELDCKGVLKQRYGVINHLRWLLFKRPGNFNTHIPIVDWLYKQILLKLFRKSDTLFMVTWTK